MFKRLAFVKSVWILCLAYHSNAGTVVTSVGYVFEAFTPYSMLRFFEFNDKEWNITENCLRDMYNYLEGLKHGTVWAVKLYDATSYYGGGFFGNANLRLHNPSLCGQLQHQYEHQIEFTVGDVLSPNASMLPFAVQSIVGHYLLEIWQAPSSYKFRKVQQLICLPQSCSSDDLHTILDAFLFQSNHIVRNNSYVGHRIVNQVYKPLYDINFCILIIIISASIVLYTIAYVLRNCLATIRENKLRKERKDPTMPAQMKLEHAGSFLVNGKPVDLFNNPETIPKIHLPKIVSKPRFNCFENILNVMSIENIVYNLLQDGDDSVPQPIFMVTFTVALLYSHLATELKLMAFNLNIEPESEAFDPISYLMDIYFFSRATTLAYEYFTSSPREQYKVLPQLQHNFKMIIRKLLSLTPSYIFCLFAEQMLDKHLHNNIALEIPSYDYRNCKVNKLRNIFYADTYLPLIERCMPWSWFISLEVQFFVVACLVLLIADVHPRYSLIIGVSIFVISLTASSVWENQQITATVNTLTKQYEMRRFNLVYDNICLRIAPYLMGLGWGYMLHKHNAQFRLNIFVLLGGWLACFIMMGFLYFGYDLLYSRANPLQRAFFGTATHSMWSLILMWIALTALNDGGGVWLNAIFCYKYLYTLERLSAICLLIGPISIRLLVFAAETPAFVNVTLMGQILFISIGCIILIYLKAFILYVLLDGPWQAILSAICSIKARI